MALFHACPHCRTLLQIPEGCEGQSARCPSCLAEFVIPGTASDQPTAPICAVAAPVAGQVTDADLKRAKQRFTQVTAENVGLQVDLARQRRRRQRLSASLRSLELFQSTRLTLDHTFGRNGGLMVAATIGPALLVLLAIPFSPSALGYLLIILVGITLAGLAYLPFSFYPEDEVLAAAIPRVTERLKEATAAYERLAAEETTQREQVTAAETEYARIKAALASRLHWLRTCRWQEMKGRNFGNFLGLALEEHGYQVETIAGAAEQRAIDMLASRDSNRAALVVAGQPEVAVDVDAVQQARSAMASQRCQSCAVVTNSRFTAPARELADRVGCKLIDGTQIPDLIEGRIVL
jgi:HJR/Mrr/RecB family endonuclease